MTVCNLALKIWMVTRPTGRCSKINVGYRDKFKDFVRIKPFPAPFAEIKVKTNCRFRTQSR